MDSFLSSSQNFVRALKANSDPPFFGGPSKLEIARAAWDQKTFYAPRKAEVIVDLILNHFAKSNETHSISDAASWKLLLDVISPSQSIKSDSWLAPLVSRIPFTRIVIQLFESIQNTSYNDHSQLTLTAHECITILWPYCVSKSNTDLLLECFAASLRLCAKHEPLDEPASHLIMLVAGSFNRSFSVSTAKKKNFSAFIRTHLEDWLLSLNRLQSGPVHSTLLECLYTSGVQCLFDPDVIRDSETENTIFHAFENSVPEIIMPILPRLFLSYIQILRKNRNAIFGQASSHKFDSEEHRQSSLRFFTSCQQILSKATQKDQSWTTKALLVDVINQEHIFTGRHLETEQLLNGIVNSALVELKAGSEAMLGPVIRCLTSLTQIDYSLIESVLPDILSRLLMVPDTVTPALELLEILLQYHVKTRTVPLYIDTVITINFQENVRDHGWQKVYEQICRSPGLHPRHLERLGKCAHEFLPLNQTMTAVRSVTERIRNLWEEYHSLSQSNDEESPRKKRKVDRGSTNDDATKALTLAISTTAIFASVVLSSFSVDSVPKETQQELEKLLNDFSSKVVLHSLSRTFKSMRKKTTKPWDDEIIALANLRLRYALGLQRSPGMSFDVDCSPKLIKQMSESVEAISVADLQLETLRTLFKSSPAGQRLTIFDTTLKILETSESFSVLHMVIQRWLPLIDLQASKEQVERFVALFVALRSRGGAHLTVILLNQTLSSAEFWELTNVRGVLLAFIERSISEVSDWANATLHQQEVVQSVFDMLLFIPIEYLSRALKLFLVKRAISIDQAMTTTSTSHHSLSTLRTYISRLISSTDLSDNLQFGDFAAYLHYLHTDEVSGKSAFEIETLELIRFLLKNLLKNDDSDEIRHLVRHYSDGLQQNSFSSHNPWARSFNIVVELLLKESPLKTFSIATQDTFRTLYDSLHRYLFPRLVSTPNALKVTQAKVLLEGWLQVLRLGRWLGLTGTYIDLYVQVLGEQTMNLFAFTQTPGNEDADFVVFGVLLEEFHLCPANIRPQRLEIVIAAYVLLAKRKSVAGLCIIDDFVSSLCPTLSPETFNHGLSFIVASLKHVNEDEASALLHLLSILLQDSPQNTFHIVQSSVTESINTFNDREIFTEEVRMPALLLLLQRCHDRPAALRQADISGIWLFIAKICVGAQVHDPTTSVETFHCIVSIATALIRLRRDLVVLTIPHLGIVLRRLIQSMQSPRSNLGPKQSIVVSSRLPSWINVQHPLSVEEGKALSRLLESLNSKTVFRKLTTSTAAPPKAESLAKPFSKHAAYVIKAYVESLNDPLCVIPAAVRKELQPGLFALCGMMNNFNRDALMASTADAGEKVIVKTLWREYEKQRYVGKG
ncbi:Urb2/Npa2 family-domain-containing protein, partial [Lentinula aff. detonsa]